MSNKIKRLIEIFQNNNFKKSIFLVYRFILGKLHRVLIKVGLDIKLIYSLYGKNSVENNQLIWNNYDWSNYGDEWGSKDWQKSVFDEILSKYIGKETTALEIGPGAGRWTGYISEYSKKLFVVDLAKRCIEICKERFFDKNNIFYFVNDGKSFPFLRDNEIDFVWSFDVFVHIDAETTESYLSEIRRILRPSGIAIIHHPKLGRNKGGWRSEVDNQLFLNMLSKNNLSVITQIECWGEDKKYNLDYHSDIISVLKK